MTVLGETFELFSAGNSDAVPCRGFIVVKWRTKLSAREVPKEVRILEVRHTEMSVSCGRAIWGDKTAVFPALT